METIAMMTFSAIRKNIVGIIASRHIAGGTIEDALKVCRWAAREHFHSIVSPWRGSGNTPERMLEQYKTAIDIVYRQDLNLYLSVKLDALAYRTDFFDEVMNFARSRGVHIHLDSLDPESAGTSLKFLERAVQSCHSIGYTLPSRWRRSLQDADRIIELGVPVRIVKGQWLDPSERRLDCVRNYHEIARRLSGRCRRVHVATHDMSLAARVMKDLRSSDTPCELEQFFSLPLNGAKLAKQLGYPYRVYVAYGSPGVPYNVRFTLTRPSIAEWILADFALGRKRPWAEIYQ